ncbi:hypothetical protein [Priestia aryabhattai]|nr:hypothetical protein [Priestia aryabhattai]
MSKESKNTSSTANSGTKNTNASVDINTARLRPSTDTKKSK